MFETALSRKHGHAFTSIDKGLIAETLLFCSNVHIVVHFGVLIDLLKAVGSDTLLRLLDDRLVTLTYLRTDFGTVTVNRNGVEYNGFAAMRHGGQSPAKKRLTNDESIHLAFERALGKSWQTRRAAKRFLSKIYVRQNIDVSGQKDGIPALATKDLEDPEYVREAVRNALIEIVPSYVPPKEFRFEILRTTDSGFIIDHNIDFAAINAMFRETYSTSDSTLTPALLVDQLLEARVDLQLASDYMAEIVTNGATSPIVRRKLVSLMAKRDKNLSDIQLFQQTLLQDARAIREAINSGEHSFDEFLAIVSKAQKFKDWLRSRNPDAGLLDEYYKAVKAETWIDRLPSKGLRLVIAFGLAAALEAAYPSGLGTLAGLGLEAADQLLLDRLLRGWRPNQFVEGPLKKFGA